VAVEQYRAALSLAENFSLACLEPGLTSYEGRDELRLACSSFELRQAFCYARKGANQFERGSQLR
jgi:hypothetical protein